MVIFDEEKQNKRIDDLRKKEEEDLAETLSGKYGIPYLDLTVTPINIDALRVISELQSREAQIAVFNEVNKVLSIGALSPQNPKTVEEINKLKAKGYAVELYMVSHGSLHKVWDRYKDLSYSFETKPFEIKMSFKLEGVSFCPIHQEKGRFFVLKIFVTSSIFSFAFF